MDRNQQDTHDIQQKGERTTSFSYLSSLSSSVLMNRAFDAFFAEVSGEAAGGAKEASSEDDDLLEPHAVGTSITPSSETFAGQFASSTTPIGDGSVEADPKLEASLLVGVPVSCSTEPPTVLLEPTSSTLIYK